MKADTFAKLVVLEALIDSEVGCFLEGYHASTESFREGLVVRVSDLVDEIDRLDAVAAAHVYDAVVDFLAELPEEGGAAVVEGALRFKRAVDRIVMRGLDRGELEQASTWAIVLDDLLEELAGEYGRAVGDDGVRERPYLRARALVARAREAADRLLWVRRADAAAELRNEIDRLAFAVYHQRPPPATVDPLIRAPQRRARRFRPTPVTRIGAYLIGQLLRRGGGEQREGGGTDEARPA